MMIHESYPLIIHKKNSVFCAVKQSFLFQV